MTDDPVDILTGDINIRIVGFGHVARAEVSFGGGGPHNVGFADEADLGARISALLTRTTDLIVKRKGRRRWAA